MKRYIIYIPGLGDHNDGLRRFFLFFWQLFGVKTELVPMRWYDGRSFDEKFDRVEAAIKKAVAKGYRVSLVGESAGGSMAMNVFARNNSIDRMMSLCGVNHAHADISPQIFKKGPAFKTSVSLLNESRSVAVKNKLNRIVSVTAIADPTVSVKKNYIPGAKHITIWSIGHFTTIVLCLSIFSFILVRELKRSV
ncbi:MAG: hypothetical protein ABJA64_02895 [Candidatus Saccharibacteria bacterium]